MKLIGLKNIPQNTIFKKGDVFVLFGELFGKGYANGLVQQAKMHQMEIIGITMGRRDEQKNLRALTPEELQEAQENLGGEIINIPLEAGFDLEKVDGISTVDLVNKIDKKDWKNAKLDNQQILKCKKQAEQNFIQKTQEVMDILYKKISPQKNIFFTHTMAGGFIRSKLLFLIANKVFKGTGDRHSSSLEFWNSEVGQLCAKSFDSVTADTFHLLVTCSQKIRQRNEDQGKYVFYSSYGYHGTEIYLQDKYQWQTYIPYQQGHAKKKLENYAREFTNQNIHAVVFNCPEILTNSSSIFLGVELPLFALINVFKKFYPSDWTNNLIHHCQGLLQNDVQLEYILNYLEENLCSNNLQKQFVFENWPMENTREISDLVIGVSEKIRSLHKDPKNLITNYLSQLILEATGSLIFNYASEPKEAVIWLGHDIVAKKLFELHIK